MNTSIKNQVSDVLWDIGVEAEFYEDKSAFVSPLLRVSDDIAACQIFMVIRIYEDAFDVSVYCAGYEAHPESLAEDMLFIGLVNNLLYPGTGFKYFPGMPFEAYRYADCFCDADTNLQKVMKNISITLETYSAYIDLLVAVDMGKISAVDAFNQLLE